MPRIEKKKNKNFVTTTLLIPPLTEVPSFSLYPRVIRENPRQSASEMKPAIREDAGRARPLANRRVAYPVHHVGQLAAAPRRA